MSSTDHVWDAAAEERHWREELEMMRHGADAIEQKAGLKNTGFYIACVGGLDAAIHFTKPERFVSRAAFVTELRRLVTEPTAPSRPVPSVVEYQRAQRRWLEGIIREYDRAS
jgi:hypothetical protein